MVDVGLFHHRQELAGIGGQRFHIPALAFGIQGVEGQRGFTGTGKACDDNQLVSRHIQVDVLQVVGACTLDLDMVHNTSLG